MINLFMLAFILATTVTEGISQARRIETKKYRFNWEHNLFMAFRIPVFLMYLMYTGRKLGDYSIQYYWHHLGHSEIWLLLWNNIYPTLGWMFAFSPIHDAFFFKVRNELAPGTYKWTWFANSLTSTAEIEWRVEQRILLMFIALCIWWLGYFIL